MPSLRARLVIIDLDGTLIDTVPDLGEAGNRMLADLGRPPIPIERYREWIGNGVPRFIKRALTGELEAEPDSVLFERAAESFDRHYAEGVSARSQIFPGVIPGLEWLTARGIPLACITNKAERFTTPLLRDLRLDRYFGMVISGDSLPEKKPHPAPLLHACRHHGVEPHDALLVGDSGTDVAAARAAGMPVVCVPYGYNHGHDIRDSRPDAVVDSLEALPTVMAA